VKLRFVQEHRETVRVGMMCRVLKVSRSGYYAWRQRQPSRRERERRAGKPTAPPGSMPSCVARGPTPGVTESPA
jgi:hypothetical protein